MVDAVSLEKIFMCTGWESNPGPSDLDAASLPTRPQALSKSLDLDILLYLGRRPNPSEQVVRNIIWYY